ncbi:MAG: hypothetical protein CSA72_08225 [Rhodobacterales bacterium]|nr:MAG: hypothetical protein CSA72_08225 [Rhodobacterales bacterium]
MRAALLAVLIGLGAPLGAQDAPARQPTVGPLVAPSGVLIIDSERMFSESAFGRRVAETLRRQTEDLAAENRRIEADLTEEERSLTERRPGMDVDQFRTEAEAFDAKVQEIRIAQDAKERALQQASNAERDSFLRQVQPVLGGLMSERGATVILDRRAVFLGTTAADITDLAIAAIDAAIGSGEAAE